MTSRVDFHTHSKASDGLLSPSELVERAHGKGVRYLALTDHDTTAGIAEAQAAALKTGLHLIPGVELSVTWENQCLHIVGLDIDPLQTTLAGGLESLRDLRNSRAIEMGRRLEKKGISGALQGARRLAGEGMITRTHFAQYLVDQNHCPTIQKAFDHYLSRGKAGYVQTPWVDLENGIGWINAAGGTAVLAHPQRYKMTATRMRKLLAAYRDAGGQAIEVVCGNSNRDDIRNSAGFAREFGLLGSVGSDFHSPDTPWTEIGRLRPFPEHVEPVWTKLGIALNSFVT
ncbi:MAG: PHP domain-containing protein [Methylococcaceae bacterium]|nr:PHP domain-containing protein [Methylococcaceae bacterium]MCI0733967.1 PHP domain-containing protein [Methylococcaceae bacterium]